MKQLIIILLLSFSASAQGPWVYDNAQWRYTFVEQSLDPWSGCLVVDKIGDTLINGVLCDELVTTRTYYDPFYSGPYTIDTNYTYKSITGDTVFYQQGGVFRVLYDFSGLNYYPTHVSTDTNPGNCEDTSYTNIVYMDTTSFGGAEYRCFGMYSLYYGKYSIGWVFGDPTWDHFNERFGLHGSSSAWLFPKKSPDCWWFQPMAYDQLDWVQFVYFSDDSLTVQPGGGWGMCGSVDIEELNKESKKLLKITDLMGRDVPDSPNTPLIYMYSDGTTEKVYRME